MDVKSFIFVNLFSVLILYFDPFVEGDHLYGLCSNSDCSAPVSRGVTIIRYSSPDDNRISFEPNEEVQIYVKEYGPKKDLWGVVVRGNKGYISKNFIRETNLFKKELVPALSEFRTSIPVADSFTASSHVHTHPYSPQSDVLSHTAQHSIATDPHLMISESSFFQQPNLVNSVPNDFSQQNVIDSAFHEQNFISSTPSSFHQPNNFMDLASQQQGFINSDTFQPNQEILNTAPNSIQPEVNRIGENQMYSSPHSINPSSDLHFQPELHQSSQFHAVHDQSSQFHIPPENSMNAFEVTGMQSQEVLQSSIHVPYAHSHSHQHFPNEPVITSSPENSVGNVHISPSSGNFNPGVPPISQAFQNSHPHPLSEQLQNIQSQHAQGIHPSLYSNTYMDNDYSETFAMLSSRGFESSDMYANQDIHVNPSSLNTEKNVDFSSVSSQSHSPSSQVSDTILHSEVDANLHTNENTIVNSDNSKKMSDDVPSESINSLPSVNPSDEQLIRMKKSLVNAVNENNLKENEESESLLEENEESETLLEENDDFDDNEDDEEEDEEGSDSLVELTSSTNDMAHSTDSQSASPSQVNSQTSEGVLELQSSVKDPIHDSSTVDSLTKEHSAIVQTEQLEIPSSKTSFDINTVLQETTFSDNAHSVPEPTVAKSIAVSETKLVDNFVQNSLHESVANLNTNNPILSNLDPVLPEQQVTAPNVFSEDLSENLVRNNEDSLTTESSVYKKEHTTPKIGNFIMENEKRTEMEQIVSPMDIDGLSEDLATYQVRNLKGEYGTTEDSLSDSEGGNDENNTQSESDSYSYNGNWFDSLKAAIDSIMSWIPEPLYSSLMDLQKKGISPRVPVFTTLCGFTCICLIVPLIYLKDRSKENKLSALLAEAEKKAYTFSATSAILEEKLETVKTEVAILQQSLDAEKSVSENLRVEFENQSDELENAKAELESCLEVIDALKDKENEFLTLINDHEKEEEYYAEHKESLDKIMKEQENSIEILNGQLQESQTKVEELEKEKEQFLSMKADYEEKLAQFDQSCNQLLQEAEVWNVRVKELNENIKSEEVIKEELMASLKAKDEEIKSLKELVETFKILDEIEDEEEQAKTKEEKLQSLLNSIMITNQLKKEEEKSKCLDEQLQLEKNKILDIEVELLEAKSEIDKLKLNYNQALQDKAEAQTKLEVLTNYFKDKEIQLQRQLGAQEADRQKKEDDVNSAERRIMLIEQENASYKSQVASMKQEMEETERTLRSQIAAQEKKAHENWIAARAAERNLENMKQEVTQLRQRLTLLEREQENWVNASRDEIIRPVPKRIPGVNEESGSQETSERGMFPLPPLHDRLPPPLPPMMLPPDRPLPPLPPPPMPPMFLPPPPPHMERHFRPQPWHMPPSDHSSDYRTTPPEFMGGRELTPPRGRPITVDGDTAPNTSSPMTTDTRNSTPPHLLPDFHDIPPQPGRPYFPPPAGRPRFPMHPPYRRDAGPEPRRIDNQNESNSRGPPQPPPSEQWQHSRV